MAKCDKPLAFRLFKVRHEYDDADGLMQMVWQEYGDPDTLQVRAISAKHSVMDSHVTYVARGGNAQDIRRRFHQLDEDTPYGDYTTAVMVDLDALGLTDVNRIRASDVLYKAILDARESLLATIPKRAPVAISTPRSEETRTFTQGERKYTVTYVPREFNGNRARLVASKVVDDQGVEYEVADGLMRAGFAQESFWDWWQY